MFTFPVNCSSRLRCGLRPYSSFLTTLLLTGFCPPPHLQNSWLLPTSVGKFLFRRAVSAPCRSLRGTLFIQDSSLLNTLFFKVAPPRLSSQISAEIYYLESKMLQDLISGYQLPLIRKKKFERSPEVVCVLCEFESMRKMFYGNRFGE